MKGSLLTQTMHFFRYQGWDNTGMHATGGMLSAAKRALLILISLSLVLMTGLVHAGKPTSSGGGLILKKALAGHDAGTTDSIEAAAA